MWKEQAVRKYPWSRILGNYLTIIFIYADAPSSQSNINFLTTVVNALIWETITFLQWICITSPFCSLSLLQRSSNTFLKKMLYSAEIRPDRKGGITPWILGRLEHFPPLFRFLWGAAQFSLLRDHKHLLEVTERLYFQVFPGTFSPKFYLCVTEICIRKFELF